MPIHVEPFSDLVFVYMDGCAACEEAMPEVDAFAAATTIPVVRIRADGPLVPRLLGRMKIKATPTYVYRRNGRGVSHEGAMNAKEIGGWIDGILAREEGDPE